MDYVFIGDLLELLGGLLIAYAVLSVHTKVLKEHKIDFKVYKEMKREQILVGIGIICLISGFFIKYFL